MSENKVYLFTGIETFDWTDTQFNACADFCIAHNIDGIILKVYEITQGPWYNKQGGVDRVIALFTNKKLDVLPYGFFYGFNPQVENAYLLSALKRFSSFCLDLESEWDGNKNNAIASLRSTIASSGNTNIWISTWANPVDHAWIANILNLNPYVNVWMPMEYRDFLIVDANNQFPKNTKGAVWPTYEVGQVTTNNLQVVTPSIVSLWEYQTAVQNPSWVVSFVNRMKGNNQVQANPNLIKQFRDIWLSNTVNAPADTGIYDSLLALVEKTALRLGPPINKEVSTVAWDGTHRMIQNFGGGYQVEWDDNAHMRIYDAHLVEVI